VDNAEAIYSLPGVDAIFVGPNDLTAQMRGPDGLDPTPEAFEAMLQRILAAGKKTGTPVGLHTQSVEAVQKRIAEGWQFLALGSDMRMMTGTATAWTGALNMKPASADLARY
jgi:4-hydroxy-2-oxoheptanedioate aldolase